MTVKHLSGAELPNDPMIADFIYCELSYKGMRNDLKRLVGCGHMIGFEYECNRYNVIYDGIKGMVTIRDAVHEENSVPEYFERISMSAADFLKILS